MTIEEFSKNYYLHDSDFENVTYDESSRELTLLINFAFWMQLDYKEGDPENGLLEVIFHDVSFYSCPDGDPCNRFNGIYDAEMAEDGSYVISMEDEFHPFYLMTIRAQTVTVNVK